MDWSSLTSDDDAWADWPEEPACQDLEVEARLKKWRVNRRRALKRRHDRRSELEREEELQRQRALLESFEALNKLTPKEIAAALIEMPPADAAAYLCMTEVQLVLKILAFVKLDYMPEIFIKMSVAKKGSFLTASTKEDERIRLFKVNIFLNLPPNPRKQPHNKCCNN